MDEKDERWEACVCACAGRAKGGGGGGGEREEERRWEGREKGATAINRHVKRIEWWAHDRRRVWHFYSPRSQRMEKAAVSVFPDDDDDARKPHKTDKSRLRPCVLSNEPNSFTSHRVRGSYWLRPNQDFHPDTGEGVGRTTTTASFFYAL